MTRRYFFYLGCGAAGVSLLVQPALAKSHLESIRQDLSVLRLVSECRSLGQVANETIDDWIVGKSTNQATLASLSQLVQRTESLQRQLQRLPLSSAALPLKAAALSSAEQLARFLQQSSVLVKSGKPERVSLLKQWRLTLASSRVCQKQWLSARDQFCYGMLQLKVDPNQRAAYDWQWKMNRLWRQQGEYFHQIQELLALEGESSEKRSEHASLALRGSLQLNAAVRACELDSKSSKLLSSQLVQALKACQQAAIEENMLFARLCEACALFYEDLSSDSISRLKRTFKNLTAASAKLDGAVLKLIEEVA